MSYQVLQKSSVVTGQLRDDIPDFKVGSVIAVHYKIIEGGKQRIQVFRGVVTDRHAGNSLDATFTVTKNSFAQMKVERTFPLHSPNIDKVEVELYQRARRSNLKKLAFDRKDLAKVLRTRSVKEREELTFKKPEIKKVEKVEEAPVETKEEAKTEE